MEADAVGGTTARSFQKCFGFGSAWIVLDAEDRCLAIRSALGNYQEIVSAGNAVEGDRKRQLELRKGPHGPVRQRRVGRADDFAGRQRLLLDADFCPRVAVGAEKLETGVILEGMKV